MKDTMASLTVCEKTHPIDWKIPTEDHVMAITAGMAQLMVSEEKCPPPSEVLGKRKFLTCFPSKANKKPTPKSTGEPARVQGDVKVRWDKTVLPQKKPLTSLRSELLKEAKFNFPSRHDTSLTPKTTDGEPTSIGTLIENAKVWDRAVLPQKEAQPSLHSEVLMEAKFNIPLKPDTCHAPNTANGEPINVGRTLIEDAKVWWDVVVLSQKKAQMEAKFNILSSLNENPTPQTADSEPTNTGQTVIQKVLCIKGNGRLMSRLTADGTVDVTLFFVVLIIH